MIATQQAAPPAGTRLDICSELQPGQECGLWNTWPGVHSPSSWQTGCFAVTPCRELPKIKRDHREQEEGSVTTEQSPKVFFCLQTHPLTGTLPFHSPSYPEHLPYSCYGTNSTIRLFCLVQATVAGDSGLPWSIPHSLHPPSSPQKSYLYCLFCLSPHTILCCCLYLGDRDNALSLYLSVRE